jgi:hypothetical protein
MTTRSLGCLLAAAAAAVLTFTNLTVIAQTIPAWTQLTPAGTPPLARDQAIYAYNQNSNRLIVFGGYTTDTANIAPATYANDLWVLKDANGLGNPEWLQLIPDAEAGSPPKGAYPAWAYDQQTNRLIVFGGMDENFMLRPGDIWILSNADGTTGPATWESIVPGGDSLPGRALGVSAYDPGSNRMIVAMGTSDSYAQPDSATLKNDVWVLSNANGIGPDTPSWTHLIPSGVPPAGRWGFNIPTAYDPSSNRLIMFGGYESFHVFVNDTWVLTNANGLGGTSEWIQLSPDDAPPSPRLVPSGLYNANNNHLVIFGGLTDFSPAFTNEVWSLTNANGLGGPPSWQLLNPSGTAPSPRMDPAVGYDSAHDRMIVFGGLPGAGEFANDTWVLTNATGAPTSDSTPPNVQCAAADQLWHASDVSIVCTASDSGSGLANPADASFLLSTSVPGSTETSNAATDTHQVCDNAGNCATAGPVMGNKIDKKPPSITITTPSNTSYVLNQAVAAAYGCSDVGSGVATCAGPVSNGTKFNTGSAGTASFVVNASDGVGNTSTASVSYTIVYQICLLYDPTKAAKSGSTIPIKLQLCDARNNDASAAGVVLHATNLVQTSTTASLTVLDAGNANPDNDFRFDALLGTTGGYIFNLQTTGLTTGTYGLVFTASNDPSAHLAYFQVR